MNNAMNWVSRPGTAALPASPPSRAGTWPLLVLMGLAIVVVTVAAYWNEQQEFSAALRDFATEQTAIAEALSASLKARRNENTDSSHPPTDIHVFATAIRSVERPHLVRVLIRSPLNSMLSAADGVSVQSPTIEAALDQGAPWARLGRTESAALGLPARTAMAGLATIDRADGSRWGIAVVASAQRERDREQLAQWRLALSVVVAAGLVLIFGGIALRNLRRELVLAHELKVASAQSEQDEKLIRSDKLATMGALAMGIAHEVSTPLGVIVGRAEQLLARPNIDERGKRAAEAIAEQATRIGAIVRGFLAIARGDTPRMEHVDPRAIGKTALELVRHRFAKAGVRLESAMDEATPLIICEPRLMEQVLVNLLLNACDACRPNGLVELRIIAADERVAFVVTDDGIGIRPDDAARVLDPFFTTKAVGEGTGFGLPIANEIVKHHRGTLTIGARHGMNGTRACVELPTASD